MEIFVDIPRHYTAIAEWLTCMLYISLYPHRWNKRITGLICCVGLFIQNALFYLTRNAVVYIWIPAMILAVFLMYLLLAMCIKGNRIQIGYYCAKAFMVAELMASLQWQVTCFVAGVAKHDLPFWLHTVLFIGIYGLIWLIIRKLEIKCSVSGYEKRLKKKDLITAFTIVILAFIFSNISFISSDMLFGATLQKDIFAMRTMGDLCGLVILFAFQIRLGEYILEQEFAAIQTVYKKQYDQYRYYQNSMEVIHMKYHDLKHQIIGLRGETDELKRKEWLDQLESELDENHLMIQTGNHVLDTILAAKLFAAQRNQIRITCVADGKLLEHMHVMDICTIFGNALDNAIESVVMLEDPTNRLIHVALSRQKNFILIQVSNYVQQEIKMEKGKLPRTSKRDAQNHGYGLKSIQRTAEKYGGSISVQTKDHWFELRILIPEKNEKEE